MLGRNDDKSWMCVLKGESEERKENTLEPILQLLPFLLSYTSSSPFLHSLQHVKSSELKHIPLVSIVTINF